MGVIVGAMARRSHPTFSHRDYNLSFKNNFNLMDTNEKMVKIISLDTTKNTKIKDIKHNQIDKAVQSTTLAGLCSK